MSTEVFIREMWEMKKWKERKNEKSYLFPEAIARELSPPTPPASDTDSWIAQRSKVTTELIDWKNKPRKDDFTNNV